MPKLKHPPNIHCLFGVGAGQMFSYYHGHFEDYVQSTKATKANPSLKKWVDKYVDQVEYCAALEQMMIEIKKNKRLKKLR